MKLDIFKKQITYNGKGEILNTYRKSASLDSKFEIEYMEFKAKGKKYLLSYSEFSNAFLLTSDEENEKVYVGLTANKMRKILNERALN